MIRLLGVLAAMACVAVTLLIVDSPYGDEGGQLHILAPVIGASFAFTGLWAWSRRPDNRTGKLMVAIGFAWLGATLIGAESPGVYTIGWLVYTLPYVLLIHLLLAFPSGRLHTRADKAVVYGAYVFGVAIQIPQLFVYEPEGERTNALLVSRNDAVFDALVTVQTFVSIVALFVAARILFVRYRDAEPRQRAALQPVLGAGLALAIGLIATLLADLTDIPDGIEDAIDVSSRLVIAAVPFAFLGGLARSRYAELTKSLVEAQDRERRRIERDLHDGAQQRLVSVALTLGIARTRASGELGDLLEETAAELRSATEELRELARGIHPAILTDRGLGPAVTLLAARSAIPVEIDDRLSGRADAAVESAAYFVVAEALTNVARYAQATRVTIRLEPEGVSVTDDGQGGADPAAGSGLRGLADRVAALGGALDVESGPGGTTVRAALPLS